MLNYVESEDQKLKGRYLNISMKHILAAELWTKYFFWQVLAIPDTNGTPEKT